MARVILSNHSHQPIVELKQAANVKWHNALNSVGYCEFDLALSDTYASPTYLNAGNYVHVFSDSADSTTFTHADFGGPMANDFEVKPNEGVVSVRAAGLSNLLNVSVINQTTTYQNVTVAQIVADIINNRNDNAPFLGLTMYTNAGSQNVQLYQINFGDNAFNTIETLVTTFNSDFEVRPDWTWASYDRQGVDNPNLVARYGNQGNVQVQASMHILNSQLFNKVYVGSDSSPFIATVTSQTSINQYGYFSEFVSASTNNIPTNQDELTMAQVELGKHEFPPVMLDNVVVVDTPLMPFGTFHLGDKIWFEAAAVNAGSLPITPLTLYVNNANTTTLPNAYLFATQSDDANTSAHSSKVGTGLGYGEIHGNNGANWPSASGLGPPSGFGILYDTTQLESQQFVAGKWQQTVQLATNTNSLIANVIARWSTYNSNSQTYKTIGTTTVSAQAMSTTVATYTMPAVSLNAVPFGPGDKLYMDLWLDITSNSTGWASGARVSWFGYSNVAGTGGNGNAISTPGYTPTALAAFASANNLPMLQMFNGLQRVLVMEYDDRNRTMTLTLGNAIYKIIRGKLSEVRLYS